MSNTDNVRPQPPSGFTVIELLVVISIVSVLVALLLPAVQSAREATRRMQCSNRMKQMGIAIHNYHSAFKHLPRAWWLETPPTHTFNGKPWGVTILPFLEQQALFDQYDHSVLGVDQLSPSNVAAIQTVIHDYVCPSTPESADSRQYTMDVSSVGLPFTATGLAPSDYCPTTGVHDVYGEHAYPSITLRGREGALQVVSTAFGGSQDGNFAGILDGLSNTFLIGERTGGPTIYSHGRVHSLATAALLETNGGGWGDPLNGEHWLKGSDHGGLSWPPKGGQCAINCTNARGFGFHSFHAGGANFLIADGSVSFVNATIDPYLFASHITRRGSEVISNHNF